MLTKHLFTIDEPFDALSIEPGIIRLHKIGCSMLLGHLVGIKFPTAVSSQKWDSNPMSRLKRLPKSFLPAIRRRFQLQFAPQGSYPVTLLHSNRWVWDSWLVRKMKSLRFFLNLPQVKVWWFIWTIMTCWSITRSRHTFLWISGHLPDTGLCQCHASISIPLSSISLGTRAQWAKEHFAMLRAHTLGLKTPETLNFPRHF